MHSVHVTWSYPIYHMLYTAESLCCCGVCDFDIEFASLYAIWTGVDYENELQFDSCTHSLFVSVFVFE